MIKSISSFDVAKRAGVSQSSVSRVFNEKWNDRISH
ncbi:LacI family DNA-binding transcriptional regulator, partial [Enterocloster bolteae]